MNTFVLLSHPEGMAQHSAGKHAQWRGYVTILVVNHGIINSISILTVVICPMIKLDFDTPWDHFQMQVEWTLAIC